MSLRTGMAFVIAMFLCGGAASGAAWVAGVAQEEQGSKGEPQIGPDLPPGKADLQDEKKLKELQAAIRKALKAVENVHYTPYNGAEAQARLNAREAAWREDLVGDNPCITGYSRARPLVLAFVKELDKEHLIHLLERSLAIAESEELHAELMGDEAHAKPRGFNYNPMLIREAVYNLSPDPEQKQRALDSWIEAEHKRVEQTMVARREELDRILAIPAEERTQQDAISMEYLQASLDEPVGSIPVWQ